MCMNQRTQAEYHYRKRSHRQSALLASQRLLFLFLEIYIYICCHVVESLLQAQPSAWTPNIGRCNIVVVHSPCSTTNTVHLRCKGGRLLAFALTSCVNTLESLPCMHMCTHETHAITKLGSCSLYNSLSYACLLYTSPFAHIRTGSCNACLAKALLSVCSAVCLPNIHSVCKTWPVHMHRLNLCTLF